MHWVGNGFPVRSVFDYNGLGRALSPFLLLDYAAPYEFPPGNDKRGVAGHPHKGFETVTVAYQGELEHRDSRSGGGKIGAGDVQWMTAGRGILHEEFHSQDFTRKGGTLQMVQLWVNLRAKDKSAKAGYQTLLKAEIPDVALPQDAGTVRVIAGEYGGQKGPAKTFTPINLWRNFEREAKDFAELSATPLPMPVLVLTGEKASGNFLIEQDRLVASNVQGQIVKGSGHWLMEEAPQAVIPSLTAFLSRSYETAAGLRLTVSEIEALPPTGAGTGTSGVSGIQTRVLTGNPTQPGAYTIQLNVPANTRIEAHDHPDDRMVTVISGTWFFGYGASFDEKELKELSQGSFYTEPPNKPHFARTGSSPAVIQISGFGPTGTRYQNQTAGK